jgi:aminoglycoside 3-N-acetyltransferase
MNVAVARAALKQGDLAWDLRQLGVRPGMHLLVHASLPALGDVEWGGHTVVRALMEVLTPRGTLLIPTFSPSTLFGSTGSGVFDPARTTSSSEIGDALLRLSGVHRSLNPTHSFAAWGLDAAELVAGHEHATTMGPDSPLGKLHARGAHVLHLGTTHATSPAKHLAETVHGAPCIGYRQDRFSVRLASGRLAVHTTCRFRAAACPLTESSDLVDRALDERGLDLSGRVGAAEATLMPLAAYLEVVLELLEKGAEGASACRRCPVRPSERRDSIPVPRGALPRS